MAWAKIWKVLVFIIDILSAIDYFTPDDKGNTTVAVNKALPKCGNDTFALNEKPSLSLLYEALFKGEVVCGSTNTTGGSSTQNDTTCLYDYRQVNTTDYGIVCASFGGRLMLYDYDELCLATPSKETNNTTIGGLTTRKVFREAFCMAKTCTGTADELEAFFSIYNNGHNDSVCEIAVHEVYSTTRTGSKRRSTRERWLLAAYILGGAIMLWVGCVYYQYVLTTVVCIFACGRCSWKGTNDYLKENDICGMYEYKG